MSSSNFGSWVFPPCAPIDRELFLRVRGEDGARGLGVSAKYPPILDRKQVKAAAVSEKGGPQEVRPGERGAERPAPLAPARVGAGSRHTSTKSRAAVLKAQEPGPLQAFASGHWPASSTSTISSSYWIDRTAGRGGGRSGRSHSFRWRRIFSITGRSPIRLMILSGPRQRGQTRHLRYSEHADSVPREPYRIPLRENI